MGFEQAGLAVENAVVFDQLKNGISAALSVKQIDCFMRNVNAAGLRIRQFEEVLRRSLLDGFGQVQSAAQLYEQLSASDQAQIREFYLTQIEEVSDAVREKYQKLYRYS